MYRSPYPCGWASCQRQASATIVFRSGRRGTHPRSARIRSADAYRMAGSPGTPRRGPPGDLPAGGLFDRRNDLPDRRRPFGPDVIRAGRAAVGQPAHGAHVGVGQVGHVDVIAKARPIRRRIVLAEDVERGAAQRRLERARDHVDFRCVVFTELAVRVRAGGVEVAQADRADPVGALEVRQRVLDRQLRLAVGVDRVGRVRLAKRRLRRLSVRSRTSTRTRNDGSLRRPSLRACRACRSTLFR